MRIVIEFGGAGTSGPSDDPWRQTSSNVGALSDVGAGDDADVLARIVSDGGQAQATWTAADNLERAI